MSSYVRKKNKSIRNHSVIQLQERLEDAIVKYQKAVLNKEPAMIERAYRLICELYPPEKHMMDWHNQYYFLYDTAEDFAQEYNYIFCKVLMKWKPRGERQANKYSGSGDFKNYFIGALQNHYSNLVKANNAAKRNIGCKCPICNTWASPLSTHLRKHHVDLLWDQIHQFGYDINTMTDCPFCKSHKSPKHDPNLSEEDNFRLANEALRKHFLSKHSTFLFQKFSSMYPDYQTIKPKEVSVWVQEDEEGEESSHYDTKIDDNKMGQFMNLNFSDLERKILENILNGSSSGAIYKSNLYKCTEAEFTSAIESIKDKMIIMGIEG